MSLISVHVALKETIDCINLQVLGGGCGGEGGGREWVEESSSYSLNTYTIVPTLYHPLICLHVLCSLLDDHMSQMEHSNLRGLCKQLKEEFDAQISERESYLKHIESQLSLEQVCYDT